MVRAKLLAVVMAIWAAMTPRGERASSDAPTIAGALVDAVLEEQDRPPALGSHEEDLAAGAVYAYDESRVRLKPGHWVDPRTGKPVDDKAFGPWQTHRLGPDATPIAYARDWLAQLHEGARICPRSPAAPLSGSCLLARPLADRRIAQARRMLTAALDVASR